jgi:predicted peptidase
MYSKHKWESDVHFNFAYAQYLPKDYDGKKKFPLVLFLHGAGERGEDLDVACRHGYMKHVRESGAEYPFIIVAPQCPNGKFWGCYTESLLAFLEDICATLAVDTDRVYLTGFSMGGTGTWMLSMAAPERFAAIAPICGSGIYWYGEALKNIPIMIYHGDCDDIVPIYNSIEMVRSVNKRGGNAQIKVLYGVMHNAWDAAYQGDELYTWLLSHKRAKP